MAQPAKKTKNVRNYLQPNRFQGPDGGVSGREGGLDGPGQSGGLVEVGQGDDLHILSPAATVSHQVPTNTN